MKVAVVGVGKTGSKVVDLISPKDLIGPFSRSKPMDHQSLKDADGVILFVPGPAVENLMPLLIESKKPCVWGATGNTWPNSLDEKLKQLNLKWMWGHNFALGMTVIKKLIKTLSQAESILKDARYSMTEVHHTKKIDAPSGTALRWKEWLNKELPIESIREGDVVGDHQLEITTSSERITLKHESLDRKVFAEGALWALKKLLTDPNFGPGLHSFDQYTEKLLQGDL